jgi:hypothetical protein
MDARNRLIQSESNAAGNCRRPATRFKRPAIVRGKTLFNNTNHIWPANANHSPGRAAGCGADGCNCIFGVVHKIAAQLRVRFQCSFAIASRPSNFGITMQLLFSARSRQMSPQWQPAGIMNQSRANKTIHKLHSLQAGSSIKKCRRAAQPRFRRGAAGRRLMQCCG